MALIKEMLEKQEKDRMEERLAKLKEKEDAWTKKHEGTKTDLEGVKNMVKAWQKKYDDIKAKLEEKNKRLVEERDSTEAQRKSAERNCSERVKEAQNAQVVAERLLKERVRGMKRQLEEEISELKPEHSTQLKARDRNIAELELGNTKITDEALKIIGKFPRLTWLSLRGTAVTGTEEQPAKAGIPVADIGAGMYAFSGILAALYTRARTGAGASLNVSLFDALTEWMGYPANYTRYGGTAPTRQGLSHAAIAPYGPFTAGDGEQVVLSVQNDPEWRALCAEVIDDAALADDARFATNDDRVAHRGELDALLGERFAALDSDELLVRLKRANIAVGRMRTVEEFLAHPAIVERDRMRTIGSPVGELQAPLPAIEWVGREAVMGDIPALGADTDAVLAEFS